jgi:RNA polymerase sigma-70 factor (ECF subfamily)
VTDIPEETALVRAARNGSRTAFGRLYELYGRMVRGVLLARAPRSEVDDLTQEVFVTAWRRIATLRDEAAFGGWLAMIARHRATDYHRTARDETGLLDNSVSTAPASDEVSAALDAIRGLPEAYRETMMLRFVEGMTGPEIAARTGLTADSVRVNLHRGMRLLRERMAVRAHG